MEYKVIRGINKRVEIMGAGGEWLKRYRWDGFGTFTSRRNISPPTMEKRFASFMDKLKPTATYFYAIESYRFSDFYHVHALIGNLELMSYRYVAYVWHKKYGIAEVEPYKDGAKGNFYVCKYIADGRTLWGFKLKR